MSTAIMEREQLEIRALDLPAQARRLTIHNDQDFAQVGEFLKGIKGLRAEINSNYDPVIAAAYHTHREAVAAKRKVEAPLIEAETYAKALVADYHAELERIRREEQLRAERIAREEAERRQLEEAALLHDIGETDSANALLEEPIVYAPPIVSRPAPKVSGIAVQKRYSAECFDLMALVRAVAAGQVPLQALEPNQTFLNRQAVALRNALQYPGVRVKAEPIVSAGRR